MTRQIWGQASPAYVPGVYNVEADEALREFKHEIERTLDKKIFREICNQLGQPNIDLFASRLNCQVNPFSSWKLDPDAMVVDSFTLDWGGVGQGWLMHSLLSA